MEMYKVWTKSGNWNFEASKKYLDELKGTYKNFYYQLIGSDKVIYYNPKA